MIELFILVIIQIIIWMGLLICRYIKREELDDIETNNNDTNSINTLPLYTPKYELQELHELPPIYTV